MGGRWLTGLAAGLMGCAYQIAPLPARGAIKRIRAGKALIRFQGCRGKSMSCVCVGHTRSGHMERASFRRAYAWPSVDTLMSNQMAPTRVTRALPPADRAPFCAGSAEHRIARAQPSGARARDDNVESR